MVPNALRDIWKCIKLCKNGGSRKSVRLIIPACLWGTRRVLKESSDGWTRVCNKEGHQWAPGFINCMWRNIYRAVQWTSKVKNQSNDVRKRERKGKDATNNIEENMESLFRTNKDKWSFFWRPWQNYSNDRQDQNGRQTVQVSTMHLALVLLLHSFTKANKSPVASDGLYIKDDTTAVQKNVKAWYAAFYPK